MNCVRFNFLVLLPAILVACFTPTNSLAQQNGTTNHYAPPTGTYGHFPHIPFSPFIFPAENICPLAAAKPMPTFTLRLETNGTYFAETATRLEPVQDGDLVRLRPYSETAKGTWRWDADKREFLLEPGTFRFYIKRLPLDLANTNRLVFGAGFLERQPSR